MYTSARASPIPGVSYPVVPTVVVTKYVMAQVTVPRPPLSLYLHDEDYIVSINIPKL